jgi:hypothetical protein
MTSTVKWHNAEKKKPDDDTSVLVVDPDGEMMIGYLDGDHWRHADSSRIDVAFWAEFPELPI